MVICSRAKGYCSALGLPLRIDGKGRSGRENGWAVVVARREGSGDESVEVFGGGGGEGGGKARKRKLRN